MIRGTIETITEDKEEADDIFKKTIMESGEEDILSQDISEEKSPKREKKSPKKEEKE